MTHPFFTYLVTPKSLGITPRAANQVRLRENSSTLAWPLSLHTFLMSPTEGKRLNPELWTFWVRIQHTVTPGSNKPKPIYP